MKNLPLNPELFVQNRERFVKMMKRNSIAVIVSNDEAPSNGDAIYRFKQNSDLYWLSGITQEDSMVILFPDNPDPKYREVLVLVRPNELKEKWDGKGSCVETDKDGDNVFTTFDDQNHYIIGGTGKYNGITGKVPYTYVDLHDTVGKRNASVVNHKATWSIK